MPNHYVGKRGAARKKAMGEHKTAKAKGIAAKLRARKKGPRKK